MANTEQPDDFIPQTRPNRKMRRKIRASIRKDFIKVTCKCKAYLGIFNVKEPLNTTCDNCGARITNAPKI